MAERAGRTPKQRVLAVWPDARSVASAHLGFWIMKGRPNADDIGFGYTLKSAWQDAASRLSTKGK